MNTHGFNIGDKVRHVKHGYGIITEFPFNGYYTKVKFRYNEKEFTKEFLTMNIKFILKPIDNEQQN